MKTLIPLSILVLVLTYYSNPRLFSEKLLWEDDFRKGDPTTAVFFVERSDVDAPGSSREPSFLYRGDAARGGHSHQPMPSRLDHAPRWLSSEAINVGVHTASKSSPAVDQTGIYVGADSGWFYAFDLEGRVKWRLFTAYNDRGIHATAALDPSSVYIGAYNGRFYRLDKATGRVLWAVRLGDTIGSSALLHKGYLYVSVETFRPKPNGYVVKLAAEDGRFIWKSKLLGNQSHSSPALDEKLGLIFVGANSQKFFALDSETGETRWSRAMSGEIKSTPAVWSEKQLVYVTDRGGMVSALEGRSGRLVWHTQIADEKIGSQSSPALIPEEKLLVVAARSGRFFGLDLMSGAVRWQNFNDSTHPYLGSPVITGGMEAHCAPRAKSCGLLTWLECDSHYLCALNPKDGKIMSKYDLDGALTGVPAIFAGSVYVSTDARGKNENPGRLIAFAASGAGATK